MGLASWRDILGESPRSGDSVVPKMVHYLLLDLSINKLYIFIKWSNILMIKDKGKSITNGTRVHGFTDAHQWNRWLLWETLVVYAHTAGRPPIATYLGSSWGGLGPPQRQQMWPHTITRVPILVQVLCLEVSLQSTNKDRPPQGLAIHLGKKLPFDRCSDHQVGK